MFLGFLADLPHSYTLELWMTVRCLGSQNPALRHTRPPDRVFTSNSCSEPQINIRHITPLHDSPKNPHCKKYHDVASEQEFIKCKDSDEGPSEDLPDENRFPKRKVVFREYLSYPYTSALIQIGLIYYTQRHSVSWLLRIKIFFIAR